MTDGNPHYAPATAQLVVEVFARDIDASKRFYRQLGFEIVEDRGGFAVLGWEGHEFYLDARPDQPPVPTRPQANMRIMVPNVDDYWQRVRDLGAPVISSIQDRGYGLRDFTILDPDGFGLRFGTWLNR